MAKKCIVWGCGTVGSFVQEYLEEDGYTVVAYCDTFKTGKINGYDILNVEGARELCSKDDTIEIIIAIWNKQINNEIEHLIKATFPNGIYYKLGTDVAKLVLQKYHEEMIYKWNVTLQDEFEEWINQIDTEVEFWTKSVVDKNGKFHNGYVNNRKNTMFEHEVLKDLVKEGDVVLDIGCGCVSKYGDTLKNGKHIELIPVDALAHFYNRMNSYVKDGLKEDYQCRFGMFEFMGYVFGENYADAIIIENAIDHCVDPFRSLVECLYSLKVDGTLYMAHNQAEALNACWTGLHRWNVDCIEGAFVFWNKENAINVSETLKKLSFIVAER